MTPDPLHRDVDSGWAWAVLAATSVGQIITGIVGASVGVLQTEFLAHFNTSNSYVSLISSIFISLQLTMGPVAGMLCNIFGIRTAMISGAVLLSLGLFLSSFATELHHILGLYSIVAGADVTSSGYGIAYTPLNVILGHYFHKRRGLSNGLAIAACGLGLGPGASFMVWIIESHGWRFSLSVLASIALHKAVIGSMYFSLEKRASLAECCRRPSRLKNEQSSKSRRQQWLWFLKHPHWWILCINYCVSMLGFAIHIVHFPSYALACGVTHSELSNLISASGIAVSLSRLLGGFLCNDSSADLLTVMFSTQGLYGVFILFMPFYARTYPSLMVYQVLMSLFYGVSMVPITPYVVQLFGVDKLAMVFGWIMMWGGLGYITGPVIAGVLYDKSLAYSNGFYVAGTAVLISSFMLLFIPLTKVRVADTDDDGSAQRFLHEDQTITVAQPISEEAKC